ncbi:PREDICTED: uncharacterized protein LOC108967837 [Bactrocera latifrons]|uniref:Uncharacterized protein n=1 Tax=Bactrocera latifrons TaxID=174628 RepID=A0A0K8UQ68_BACLA|nr:PREDICTED: uncharacterized protein LOC108967837 [Bactrocera latifrons]
MHKYCHDAHCPCNSCCGATTMLQRNCSSCIWPRQSNHDEWKCYSRCLTDHYKQNLKQHFDTVLWRRAKRARQPPASMMNLSFANPLQEEKTQHYATTAASQQQRKTGKKKQQKIKRPAEIIIEQPNECRGGLLRKLAQTPNCDCQRMRTLLLQQALLNECNCDPYDLLPDVPLTFYPKWPGSGYFDDNTCTCLNDDDTANFLRYISSDGQYGLNVKQLFSKEFLAGLNTLYANVGGGKDAAFGFNDNICEAARQYEFEGFFGRLPAPLLSVAPHTRRRHSKVIQPHDLKLFMDRGTLLNLLTSNHRMTGFHSLRETFSAESSSQSFRYPTEFRSVKKRHFKTSPRQILRYLGRRKTSKNIS